MIFDEFAMELFSLSNILFLRDLVTLFVLIICGCIVLDYCKSNFNFFA